MGVMIIIIATGVAGSFWVWRETSVLCAIIAGHGVAPSIMRLLSFYLSLASLFSASFAIAGSSWLYIIAMSLPVPEVFEDDEVYERQYEEDQEQESARQYAPQTQRV